MTEPHGHPAPTSWRHSEPVDAPPPAFIAAPSAPQGGRPSDPYAQAITVTTAVGSAGGIHAFGYPNAVKPGDKTNGMAITALILGITGFLILPACIGLGLGLGALGTIKRTGQPGKGLAIAGAILSSGWLVFWLIGIILA